MKSLGGFLELETNLGNHYHPNLLALNSGRNALKILLQNSSFQEIYLPYFICQVVVDVIQELNINICFYDINNHFEIKGDIPENSCLLYVNYFGIKQDYVEQLRYRQLIIDNSQAFFAKPLQGNHSFYSPRKFFGIPDGGYLATDLTIENLDLLSIDSSEDRFTHLLKRVEFGPEEAYSYFTENENIINNLGVKKMSRLTTKMLQGVNYDSIKNKRRSNFELYHSLLSKPNEYHVSIGKNDVPLCYPLVVNNNQLRGVLRDQKIYIPYYWPEIEDRYGKSNSASRLSHKIFCLPVDQGLETEEIEYIVNKIQKIIE